MPKLLALLVLLLPVAIASQVTAQDPFATPTVRKPIDDSAVPPDAHVRQLNEFAGQNDNYLADAISQFARIKNWTDADRWLKAAGQIGEKDRLSAIANRIGPDNLFRLASTDEISAAAKAAITKLNSAAREDAQQKQKLLQAIDGLDAPSVDVRLDSARKLLAGGMASVALLTEAATSSSPTAPRDEILRAILQLGGNGPQAFRQLALYGDDAIRLNALKSLTRIDRRAALPDLVTAVYGANSIEQERAFAETNLRSFFPEGVSAGQAKSFLLSELRRLRRVATETENSIRAEPLWSVGADRKSVSWQNARSIMLAYRNAFDAGARLRRIGDLPQSFVDEVLAADLSYRVIIDPDWGSKKQVAEVQSAFGSHLNTDRVVRSLETALASSDHPSLIGLTRLIGGQPQLWNTNALLAGRGVQFSPLVRCAMNSDPRVRYEAAVAITRLNPPTSYAGSSHVMRCLSEMRALEDQAMVILVETRADVSLRQEVILAKLGYQTEVVGTAVGVEHLVARGGDLRMILSKTQLADVPPVELIDRVRRQPLGKNVPILFYGDLIDEEDLAAELRTLAEGDRALKASANEYLASISEADQKVEVTEILERLRNLGREYHYQEAQAKLRMILIDFEKLDTLSPQAESAWEEAVKLASARIKAMKKASDEVYPVVRPKLDADRLGINTERWAGISRLIDRPRTPAAFSDLLMDLDLVNRLPELTALDRQLYRQVASDFLASRGR